ncbi:MAG: glutamate dehydrogenase, partial [Novosphingobium sp.]
VEEEGATLAQVTTAFVAAEQLLGMGAIWQGIETQPMPEAARILLFDRAAAAMVNHMADLLRVSGGALSAGELVAQLEGGVTLLSGATGRLLSREGQALSAALQERFVAAGAPGELAAAVAHLFDLDGSVGLAMLARQTGTKPEALTRAFIALGRDLGLDWAQQAAERLAPTDPWERLLVNSLARDIQHMRLDFLRRHADDQGEPLAVVERWTEAQAPAIRQFRAVVTRAQAAPALSPTMLAQIGNQARNLLAR